MYSASAEGDCPRDYICRILSMVRGNSERKNSRLVSGEKAEVAVSRPLQGCVRVRNSIAQLLLILSAALVAATPASAASLRGHERSDHLVGTRGSDTLRGMGGDDRLDA